MGMQIYSPHKSKKRNDILYLHLGQEVVVKTSDIVGIFDLEKTSTSKKTKEFLSSATKHAEVITVSYEMPKTFIITKSGDETKVYISQISSATIKKRQTTASVKYKRK